MITALIDADSLCYAVGFSSNDAEEKIAIARLEQTMTELCMDLDCEDYKGFLTGKGNFRDSIFTGLISILKLLIYYGL